jgi:endonuclease/exonuclease/phosphatase family metal-dependent hydrolase
MCLAAAASDFDWQPFIGRSLAFLCLHLADMRSKTILEQAEFLMAMGMPRREAAVVVGSTDNSLSELVRRKAKKVAAKARAK